MVEWADSKTAILEGTVYEDNSFLSPDEIKELEEDKYYTHNIQMSPEVFQINARGYGKYESVMIAPLGDADRFALSGVVEIQARSDDATAIYVRPGTIQSDYFRSRKYIATSTSDNDYYPVETVMSNLYGLNIAFIVSDKTQFMFDFKKSSDYTDYVRYNLDIYLNGMKILTNYNNGYFEVNLTEDKKNSISVTNNISNSDGIWRYKDTYGDYKNIVGCYTTLFNKEHFQNGPS